MWLIIITEATNEELEDMVLLLVIIYAFDNPILISICATSFGFLYIKQILLVENTWPMSAQCSVKPVSIIPLET